MYNKIVKSLRWVILAGMLYTLYTIMLKDDVEFNNQTDEATLVKMAKNTNKSLDKFTINKQLIKLFPQNKEHQKSYDASVLEQANKLIDAHEKMLFPMPLGNYRYVRNIRFAKDKDSKYALILNLTSIFDKEVPQKTQNTIKSMLKITHDGMYKHYGFEEMRLLLVPTFDSIDSVEVLDLNRTTLELPELGSETNIEALPSKQ
ncbi:hypothetical protein [Sulfurimonas sp.]|uniref:hypothetical protein n=1 Tax=Sulfurimonas sp. TaxID=2022749 RepID=UPI0025DA27F9|nr:hypothetical protein [Sulfurimonas sp.]